jgi:hypothetical protein
MSDKPNSATSVRPAKMQFCANCGAELGVYIQPYNAQDTCGARECERAARDWEADARAEAHEQLDRDNGWGQW